jgi:membrane-bound lytic murein transglycosylase B
MRTSPHSEPQGALLELETETGKEYWVAFNNFYVITRYNRSPLYAMAVYQLARAIRDLHTQEESI